MIPALLLATLSFVIVLSMIYWVLANRFLAEWLGEARGRTDAPPPPITFLRPVKGGTPRLVENLDALAHAVRTDDQIVLGVEAGSETAARCEQWRGRFPEHAIVLVPCAPGVALNPKISKLVQMTPLARHEHWVLSDSEAAIDREFMEAFRAEWAESKAEALTAGYRFVNLETLPQRLDAAAVLLTLWPGLAWVRRFGAVRLTLGACTAFRRSDIAAVGGWAAFGEDLAEDNRLGAALAKAGRTVRLSAAVVSLASEALSWGDYWRHQRRVAVTYRVANPAGFAGSIVTHGIALAGVTTLIPTPRAVALGALLFLVAWVVRWITAQRTARVVSFSIPRLGRILLLASFVESVCWVLAWFSRRVWWAGKWWRVSRDGKLRSG